jgi:hypothetical protein
MVETTTRGSAAVVPWISFSLISCAVYSFDMQMSSFYISIREQKRWQWWQQRYIEHDAWYNQRRGGARTHVYGKQGVITWVPFVSSKNPQTIYSISKLTSSMLIHFLALLHLLPLSCTASTWTSLTKPSLFCPWWLESLAFRQTSDFAWLPYSLTFA